MTDGMKYEPTKRTKKPSNSAVKGEKQRILNDFGTFYILWHIVKRHKVALLAIGNIILLLNWAVPAWTDILKDILTIN